VGRQIAPGLTGVDVVKKQKKTRCPKTRGNRPAQPVGNSNPCTSHGGNGCQRDGFRACSSACLSLLRKKKQNSAYGSWRLGLSKEKTTVSGRMGLPSREDSLGVKNGGSSVKRLW